MGIGKITDHLMLLLKLGIKHIFVIFPKSEQIPTKRHVP